ncbi:hypothetical protein A2332_02360 [Candidatus Uhrbacteria bacterium RIFOXYB2_FULL_41_18]|nr:MAG: hypothetical protein A2332_02360 [Candidatus Uhrbacteria bacterium RIFOXYB2_FULL_41_18]
MSDLRLLPQRQGLVEREILFREQLILMVRGHEHLVHSRNRPVVLAVVQKDQAVLSPRTDFHHAQFGVAFHFQGRMLLLVIAQDPVFIHIVPVRA